jgi:hypothetical protein
MSQSSQNSSSSFSTCENSPISSNAGSDQSGNEKLNLESGLIAAMSEEPCEESATRRQLSFSDCETCEPTLKLTEPVTVEQLQIDLAPAGKRCFECRRLLPVECFARIRSREFPGREFLNRRCNQCRAKREKSTRAVVRRRALYDQARNRPCTDCGQSFPSVCMCLYHARGEKKFSVATMHQWKPDDVLKAEMEKCDPVCSNCRRIRDSQRLVEPGTGRRRGRPPKFLAEVRPDMTEVKPGRRSMELLQAGV